jgi:hypothetical protein
MLKNVEICGVKKYVILHTYKKNGGTYQNICRFYISVNYPEDVQVLESLGCKISCKTVSN